MSIEQQENCLFDSLNIYAGPDPMNDEHAATLCGYGPPGKIRMDGNVMRLDFQSDDSVAKEGFYAEFGAASQMQDSKNCT